MSAYDPKSDGYFPSQAAMETGALDQVLSASVILPVTTRKRTSRGWRSRAKSGLRLKEMGFDCCLVPFESYSRHIGYMQKPVLYLIRPLENWIGPILPL